MKNIIARGAEAILIKKGAILIKDRIKKAYRIKELDDKLRRQRTKKESKLLKKLENIIPVPKILSFREYQINMELINGEKLSDNFDKIKNINKICKEIGKNIANLHEQNIIHGDLTTSNMILSKNKILYFIDFGLSFESSSYEDKAVDLHVMKESLEAKHYKIAAKCWEIILKIYKKKANYSFQILNSLKKVEKRGRYKQSY